MRTNKELLTRDLQREIEQIAKEREREEQAKVIKF